MLCIISGSCVNADDMATGTNTEKQCRTVLLLTRASTEMMRGVITKHVSMSGQSLDDFLKSNSNKITHNSKGKKRKFTQMEDILLPAGGTNINEWELNVLCFVITDVCVVQPAIADSVDGLKEIRNKLYHAADLSDEEYSDLSEAIEKHTLTCCQTLNDVSLTERVVRVIESLKQDILSYKEYEEYTNILKSWKESDKCIEDKLEELSIGKQKRHIFLSFFRTSEQNDDLLLSRKYVNGYGLTDLITALYMLMAQW